MRMERARRIPAAAALAAAALLCAPAGAAPLRFAFKVPSLSGGTISSEDLKGKIVVVDVWATWCGPCRMVIPHLVKLQEKFGGKGVTVLGLNSDDDADTPAVKDAVRKFVHDHAINYPIGLMNAATYVEVARVMGFNPREGFSIPTTVVLARNGQVVSRYPGYYPGQEVEIEKLISGMIASEGATNGKTR